MAKQIGILPLSGAIDTITFTDTKHDGRRAGKKTRVNKERIANDPAFLFTRQNNAEFARAGSAANLLVKAGRKLLSNISDERMFSRLFRITRAIVQSDPVNDRGKRTVVDGNITLLGKFNFNQYAEMKQFIVEDWKPVIDRVAGTISLTMDSYHPISDLKGPLSSTHYKLSLAAIALDFEREEYVSDLAETAILPWNDVPVPTSTLTCHLPAATIQPIVVLLSVRFYQFVNGKYPLLPGVPHAAGIVGVDVM